MTLNQAAVEAEASRIAALLAQQPDTDPSELLSPDEWKWYRDHLLTEWTEAQQKLEAAKAIEMERRKIAVRFAFDPNKQTGTERIQLGNGWQAKAVKKINYGWIKTDDGKTNRDAIETVLGEIEAASAAGQLIADRLVKWNPELSLTEYNQLPNDFKAMIDKVIVTSEGSPTLEIIPPKTAK